MTLHLYCLKCSNYRLYYLRVIEMLFRTMENRGSKLNFVKFKKEQRVDDSLFLNLRRFKNIRCTLRGFERMTYAGILSNQILNKRLYSTTNDPKNIKKELFKDKAPDAARWGAAGATGSPPLPHANTREGHPVGSFNLNPWFVTGFTDGDGSFAVSITVCFFFILFFST